MRFLPIFVVLALSTGAFGQDTERLEAAKAYVDSKGQQGLMDDMLSPEGVMASMGLLGDQLTPEQQTTVARIVSEELATIRPTMENAMISGMAENFTLDEINALADFYASEHGASAMRKMTPFMTQTMQNIGPAFQRMQVNLARRIQEEFSK